MKKNRKSTIPNWQKKQGVKEKMKLTKKKHWTYKDCVRATKREISKLFREKKLEDFDIKSSFINTGLRKRCKGRFTLIVKFVDK